MVIAAKSDAGKELGKVKVRNSESFRWTTVGGSLGMTGMVVRMATIAIKVACRAKDDVKTHRFCGPKNR